MSFFASNVFEVTRSYWNFNLVQVLLCGRVKNQILSQTNSQQLLTLCTQCGCSQYPNSIVGSNLRPVFPLRTLRYGGIRKFLHIQLAPVSLNTRLNPVKVGLFRLPTTCFRPILTLLFYELSNRLVALSKPLQLSFPTKPLRRVVYQNLCAF